MPTWLLLAIAICSEVVGTVALRQSDGFTRPLPVLAMLASYVLALYLLSVIVREFPIGLAYAIWAGAGTALIATVGVILFDEPLSPLAVAGIGLVVTGVVVINLSSSL